MKSNIEVEDLLKLSNKQILKLSEKVNLSHTFWNTEEHIADARKVFENSGDIHSTFINLIHTLDAIKMLDIITENHSVSDMRQECIIPNEPDYGLQWYVELFHDVDVPKVESINEELIYALWELLNKVYLVFI